MSVNNNFFLSYDTSNRSIITKVPLDMLDIVRCAKCRHTLMLSSTLIGSHGFELTDQQNCSSGQFPLAVFVNGDLCPPFIQQQIAETRWTKGKLKCPNCKMIVGSHNFLQSFSCSCGQTQLPVILLHTKKIDILPVLETSPPITRGQRTQNTCSDENVAMGTSLKSEFKENSLNNEVNNMQNTGSSLTLEHHQNASSATQNHEGRHSAALCFGGARPKVLSKRTHSNNVKDTSLQDNRSKCKAEHSTAGSCELREKGHIVERDMRQKEDTVGRMDTNTEHSKEAFGCRERRTVVSDSQKHQHQRDGNNVLLERNKIQQQQQDCPNEAVPMESLEDQHVNHLEHVAGRNTHDCHDLRRQGVSPGALHKTLQHERERGQRHNMTNTRDSTSLTSKENKKIEPTPEEVDQDDLCAVCYEIRYKPHTLHPCGHVFCVVCLWSLAEHGSPSQSLCPMCRARIIRCILNEDLQKKLKSKYSVDYTTREKFVMQHCHRRTRRLPSSSQIALNLFGRRRPDQPHHEELTCFYLIQNILKVACAISIAVILIYTGVRT